MDQTTILVSLEIILKDHTLDDVLTLLKADVQVALILDDIADCTGEL